MRSAPPNTPRGLTLLELMFAISITAIVGAAITAMLGAVVTGVETRRDSRSLMVRSHVAQSRLAAYIVPSRAILDARSDRLVLWFDDSRESGTVHGSEIRWLIFDSAAGTITAHYVKFPDSWDEIERMRRDHEHDRSSDWTQVLRSYETDGYIATVALVDGLAGLQIATDAEQPLSARHVALRLSLAGAGGEITTLVSGSLRRHAPPVR